MLSLAWAVATWPLSLVLAAVGGAAFSILVLRRPWLIWPALAVTLPAAGEIKLGAASLLDVGLATAVGLWLADGVRKRRLRLSGSSPLTPLVLYVAALLLSVPAAQDLGEAAREVVKWLEFGLVLLLAGEMLSPKQAFWLVVALLAGGAAQGLVGLYQFAAGIGPVYFLILGRFMRASGSFGQPNPYAGYLGLTLPVALSLMWWSFPRWTRSTSWDDRRLGWALFYGGCAGAMAAGILASWSRGGWLGAAAGLTVVVMLRSRRAATLAVAGALLLCGAFLMGAVRPELVPAPVTQRLADVTANLGLGDVVNQPVTDANFSVVERVAHWVAAVRMWESSPWVGVGPGNYAVAYPAVRLPQWEEPLGHAHNIYLNALAETGVVGLAAYLVLWGSVAVWVWRRLRKAEDSWSWALGVGVLGILAHLSTHNFFDNLFVQGMYLHVGLWLAAVTAATKPEQSRLRVS